MPSSRLIAIIGLALALLAPGLRPDAVAVAAPSPYSVSGVSVSPLQVSPGQTVNFSVSVQSRQPGTVTIMMVVENNAESVAWSQQWPNQVFGRQQKRTFSASWATPSTLPAGARSVTARVLDGQGNEVARSTSARFSVLALQSSTPTPIHTPTVAPTITPTAAPTHTPTLTPTNTPMPTATSTPAASSGLVLDAPLSLSATTLSVGQTLSASVTYRNPGATAVTLQKVLIAADSPTGTRVYFSPSTNAMTVPAGATTTLNAALDLGTSATLGTWQAFSSWQDSAGAWRPSSNTAFSVVSAVSTEPTPTATPSSGTDWRMVWADEFNGTSVDSGKWVTDRMPHGGTGYFDAHILSRNTFVQDGALHLLLKRETVETKQYTTGVAHSFGKFDFLYGKVEFRAKHNANPGIFPALWLQRDGTAVNEAVTYEIDVLEVLGNDPHRGWFNIHYWDSLGRHTSKGTSRAFGSLAGAWHIYEVEWTPTTVIWRVDGVEVYRVTSNEITVSPKPMYLILNNGLGGWNNNTITSSTGLPDDFQVDYVRVYQR